MYNVSITNNYYFDLTVAVDNSTVKAQGGQAEYENWGTTYIDIPGMGSAVFIDLGDTQLSQFTNPDLPWTEYTWGGLIRFQGIEAYFRYEGQGQVNLTVDNYGSLDIGFPQGGMTIALPDITVTTEQSDGEQSDGEQSVEAESDKEE